MYDTTVSLEIWISTKIICTYLDVLDVWERYSDADDGSGVVVGEVESFAHLSAANGDEESAVDGALTDGTFRCRLDHLKKQF